MSELLDANKAQQVAELAIMILGYLVYDLTDAGNSEPIVIDMEDLQSVADHFDGFNMDVDSQSSTITLSFAPLAPGQEN